MRCTVCADLTMGRPKGWIQIEVESNSGSKYVVACPAESIDVMVKAVRDVLTEMRGALGPTPQAPRPRLQLGKKAR